MNRHQKGCDLEKTGVRLELLDWKEANRKEGKHSSGSSQSPAGITRGDALPVPASLYNIHHDYRE